MRRYEDEHDDDPLHVSDNSFSPHPLSRGNETSVTYFARFSHAWPVAVPTVAAVARDFGNVRPADVDDLVQETAARILAKRLPFADESGLRALARGVARHVALGWHRKAKRILLVPMPDAPATTLVADEVEARIQLASTMETFRSLRERDRIALTEFIATGRHEGDLAERNRRKRRLHYIRSGLERSLSGLAGSVGWLRERVRLFAECRPEFAVAAVSLSALVVGLAPNPTSSQAHATTVIVPGASGATPNLATIATAEPVRTRSVVGSDARSFTRLAVEQQQEAAETDLSERTTTVAASTPIGPLSGGSAPNETRKPLVCAGGPVIGDRTCADLPPEFYRTWPWD